jgi:hypothetical protein
MRPGVIECVEKNVEALSQEVPSRFDYWARHGCVLLFKYSMNWIRSA